MTTYQDLFEFVAKKCNFRYSHYGGELIWDCSRKLEFVEVFCKENNVDFGKVKERAIDFAPAASRALFNVDCYHASSVLSINSHKIKRP